MEKFNAHFRDANLDDYSNPSLKRQLKILKDLGTSILSDEDLSALNKVKNDMSTVYNNAKICPFDKPECNLTTEGLTLDPHIENLMASSRNFDELKWLWNEWHDKSGKLMRTDYKSYIDLMNKAADANGNSIIKFVIKKKSKHNCVKIKIQDTRMLEKCGVQNMKTIN
jgi:peptidyl-dipeptidase A